MKFVFKDAVARLKIAEMYKQFSRGAVGLVSVSAATVILSVLLTKVDARLHRIEQNQIVNSAKAQASRDRVEHKVDSLILLNKKQAK